MIASVVCFDKIYFIFGWIYYSFIIVVSWIFLYNKLSKNRKLKQYPSLFFIVIFIFGVFATISPDYYSYSSFIEKVQIWIFPQDVELLYAVIIPFLNFDFYLFRLSIIIPSFLGLAYIFKRYSIDFNLTLCVFIIFNLLAFSTTIRSSLADVIFFLGILMLYRSQTLKSVLLCLILSVISCFFHKSAFMLLIPFTLSLILKQKTTLKIAIICFPIAVIIGNILVSTLLGIYFENSIYTRFQPYLSGAVRFSNYMTNTIFFVITAYTLWLNRNNLKCNSRLTSFLFYFVFWGFYIWIILCFIGVSRYMASRFLSHIFLPLLLLMASTLKKGNRKYIKTILIMALIMIAVNEFSTLTKFREYLI